MTDNTFQFPEQIQKALSPEGKRETKMLIAQGLIPMTPSIMIEALKTLTADTDKEISQKALETVIKIPENILLNFVQNYKLPETLGFLAIHHTGNEKVIEKILINQHTPDLTVAQLALSTNEKLSSQISNNQVRILRTPQIAENLKKNPKTLKSDLEKMISFLRMNGVVFEGESPELSIQEIEAILQMAEDPDELIPQEYIDDIKDSASDEHPVRVSLFKYIQTINTGKKIKLALKGNKEARSFLVKDANKVVSSAVIKNPRITEAEILNVCLNKAVNEELIRLICIKPDWIKHYSIQLALANNPKTPFPLGLKFTRMLTANDLKKLSKNKNAPGQLQKIAKTLYESKNK